MPQREIPEKFLVGFSFAGEQRKDVRSIAETVESQLGVGTTFLDEWFEHYIAGDDADLRLQNIYGERCHLVVVCVSQRYGDKPWTLAEHAAIRARVMKSRLSESGRLGVLPIRVGDGDVEGILFNTIVPDVRNRKLVETAKLIVDRLLLIVPELKATSCGSSFCGVTWPEEPPRLTWPMANHCGVRDAFAELLTSRASCRLLPIRGPSETGKSHITKQMLANVLAIPEIACGRFDFKGTTEMDRELRAFVQDLGVQAPPSSLRLDERLSHILVELRQRAQPTVLIFDTYEMVGETQEWVEKQLLQCLVRATWLRIVIAGQKSPDPTGSIWSAVTRSALQLESPPPADWFDFGRQHRPDLTLADVETACRLASQKGSILSQLLGPKI